MQSNRFPQHMDGSVKIAEGPGETTCKPGGIGTLPGLLKRVQQLEAPSGNPQRQLCVTKKKNGYRMFVTFDENGSMQAYSSGGKVSEEFTHILATAAKTYEFNPLLFKNRGRLVGEGLALIDGKEVGHSNMAKALMLLRRCKEAGIDPKEIGLEFVIQVFALSSLGTLKPYQLYSKAFELDQLKTLTAVTKRGEPGAQKEWTVLRVVESMTFRVEPDGSIVNESGRVECQRQEEFGKHLLQTYGADDEGFVVYAHNSTEVAGSVERFHRPDERNKRKSKTFSKCLAEFKGVFAVTPGENRSGDLAVTLFTVRNPGDAELVHVGSMPRPKNWPGVAKGQAALYTLRCTWVYSNGSVAGVKPPWDARPDVVALDRACLRVTPVSEIVAGNRHREAVLDRETRLKDIEKTVLPRVLARKADARNAPDTRTTREVLDTIRDVLPAGAHKFLPADSHTMRSVQAAQAAPDRQQLSFDNQILANYVDMNGLSNDVKDVRRVSETVVITDVIEMSAQAHRNLCETYGREVLVLPLRWLVDSIREGKYLPTDGYSVVEPPTVRAVKRPRPTPAGESVPEPGLVRCYTNGLEPVSRR